MKIASLQNTVIAIKPLQVIMYKVIVGLNLAMIIVNVLYL